MANKKKRRSQQGFASKIMNAGLIALGFSGVIKEFVRHGFSELALKGIVHNATFGLASGSFDLDAGLSMYIPVGAAVALGKTKQYLMRHFPVR